MDEEQTSDLVIDTVDYTPNMLFGFTVAEMMMCFGAVYGLLLVPLWMTTKILFGTILYGFVLDALVSGFVTYRAAIRAQVLKKDRPSYMIWIDLRRKLQDEGILGIKINFKLVSDAVWEIKKSGR